ncbi:MAG TPA: hypothetical protein PKD83_01900 [Ignavibacteria bacterium]|nr:hypothetical protein [Ignavibacteria bacterium]
MKFISAIILTAALSYIAGMFLPWWIIAVIAFLTAVLLSQKPMKSFLCGFISIFLLWAGMSFWISFNNNNILAYKISMLIFNISVPSLLIIVTGFTGGLVAGFAALAGSYLRYRPERIN